MFDVAFGVLQPLPFRFAHSPLSRCKIGTSFTKERGQGNFKLIGRFQFVAFPSRGWGRRSKVCSFDFILKNLTKYKFYKVLDLPLAASFACPKEAKRPA